MNMMLNKDEQVSALLDGQLQGADFARAVEQVAGDSAARATWQTYHLVGEVLRVVESLAQEGMTLMMVTHEMAFARKVSDRVIFMHLGRVHEMGPPEELFGNPQTPELRQFLSSLH